MHILGCQPDYFSLKGICGHLHKAVKELAVEMDLMGKNKWSMWKIRRYLFDTENM